MFVVLPSGSPLKRERQTYPHHENFITEKKKLMENHTPPADNQENAAKSEKQQAESSLLQQFPVERIEEAYLLLTYATQKGLNIDQSIVSVIVNSGAFLAQGQWSAEQETAFWMAFDTLSRKVQPVSISSLKATRAYVEYAPRWRKTTIKSSGAERIVSTYQKWTLLVLTVLLVMQIYWLIGSVIINAVAQDIPKQVNELTLKIEEAATQLNTAIQEENEAAAQLAIAKRDKYENDRKNLEDSKNVYYDSLRTWNKVLCLGVFCSQETDAEFHQKGFIKARQAAHLVLQPIQLYILPLLYGLLGASAFVLRSITREIRDLTYTTESDARYRLRIQLGALAGLAVGWFLFAAPDVTTTEPFCPLNKSRRSPYHF